MEVLASTVLFAVGLWFLLKNDAKMIAIASICFLVGATLFFYTKIEIVNEGENQKVIKSNNNVLNLALILANSGFFIIAIVLLLIKLFEYIPVPFS